MRDSLPRRDWKPDPDQAHAVFEQILLPKKSDIILVPQHTTRDTKSYTAIVYTFKVENWLEQNGTPVDPGGREPVLEDSLRSGKLGGIGKIPAPSLELAEQAREAQIIDY